MMPDQNPAVWGPQLTTRSRHRQLYEKWMPAVHKCVIWGSARLQIWTICPKQHEIPGSRNLLRRRQKISKKLKKLRGIIYIYVFCFRRIRLSIAHGLGPQLLARKVQNCPPSPALQTCQKKCQKSSKRHPLKIDSRERFGADLAEPPMFKPHFSVERMFFWAPGPGGT